VNPTRQREESQLSQEQLYERHLYTSKWCDVIQSA